VLRSIVCLLALSPVLSAATGTMSVRIDASTSPGPLPRFWTGCGFTTAERIIQGDYRQYIAYMGSVPYGGIDRLRIHHMGRLVGRGEDKWRQFDEALDVLWRHRIGHLFEIMDFGPRTKDCDEPEGINQMRKAVAELAAHLIERYGQDEVRSWLFETMNENRRALEQKHGEGYIAACVAGLADVDPALRFGGPGYRPGSPLSFVRAAMEAPNPVTGGNGSRLDFVSVHIKDPATVQMDKQVRFIEEMRAAYPSLTGVLWINDENDPWGGWHKHHDWAAGPQFAAYVANSVAQGLYRIRDGLGQPYATSHDNAFLGMASWSQRTQLIGWHQIVDQKPRSGRRRPAEAVYAKRFPWRGDSERFALIKKAAHQGHVALAFLGRERLAVEGAPEGSSNCNLIATRLDASGDVVAILLYNDRGPGGKKGRFKQAVGDQEIALQIQGLPSGAKRLVHYRIDAEHSNPHQAYPVDFKVPRRSKNLDKPPLPTAEDLATMRRHQELERSEDPKDIGSGSSLSLTVPMPENTVSLLVIARDPGTPPAAPERVWVEDYTGLHGTRDRLVCWWEQDERHLRTYEVLRRVGGGSWERVNEADQVATAWLDADAPEGAQYAVRAVDLWDRSSDDVKAGPLPQPGDGTGTGGLLGNPGPVDDGRLWNSAPGHSAP